MLKFFSKKKQNKESLMSNDDQHKAAHLHSLVVSDVRRETEDTVSVAFDLPSNLESLYHFKPGQYLTLRTYLNGEEVRRSYSICSSPLEGELRVAIKKVENGLFSTFANQELKIGDTLDVMTPLGNFTCDIHENEKKKYVAFAAGSGITPVMSLIKSTLEVEPESTFTLFYGNKTGKTIIFKSELEDLKDKYLNRLEIHHVLSREDQGTDYLKGRIDADKVSAFAGRFFEPAEVNHFFICGPEEMINAAKDTLANLGVAKEKVHFELFTTSTPKATKSEGTQSKTNEVLSQVTVVLDGEETHFDISSKGNTILDAALDAGADVPYACKGAVCCTCRAKVLEGTVEMEMNYALVDEEVADGYILTCQSHPTSEKVVVSFDE